MLNFARPAVRVRLVATVVLAAVLAVSWSASAPAATNVETRSSSNVDTLATFVDVDDSVKFEREITWLANEGIATGWRRSGGSEFRPYENITREAMAAFLYRLEGSPRYNAPVRSPFIDVSTSSTNFTRQIGWLAQERVSNGWTTPRGAEFRPRAPITRDAMAAFLYRLAGSPAVSLPAKSPFVDVTPSSSQFYKEIVWLSQQGISTGWRNGPRAEFRPLNTITRDAMAAFLYRYSAQVDPEIAPVDGVVVAPEVTIVDETMAQDMVVSQGSIVFSGNSTVVPKPNDVLVAGVTDATPSGLLVRVESVRRSSDGSRVAITSPATLTDAIFTTGGAVEVQGDLVSASGEALDPDATVTTGLPASKGMSRATANNPTTLLTHVIQWEGKFGADRKRVEGSAASGSVAFGASLTATAEVSSSMIIDISLFRSNEVKVVVTPSLDTETSKFASIAASFKEEIPIAQLTQYFTFAVGPVPVVVVANEKISFGLSITGAATADISSSTDVSADYGFHYQGGDFSLINTKPAVSNTNTDLSVSGSLTPRASLDIDAEVTLYGLAGITFGFGPYVEIPISVTFGSPPSWSCPVVTGVQARVGVVAGIRALGFTLTEWRAEATNDWELHSFNPCAGTIPILKPAPEPEPDPDPTPGPADLTITRSGLSDATVGEPYATTLRASGGVPPYSWDAEGLPAGLTITEDGKIEGTPIHAGSASLLITVTDSTGVTATQELGIEVVTAVPVHGPAYPPSWIDPPYPVYMGAGVSDDGRYVSVRVRSSDHSVVGPYEYIGPAVYDRQTGKSYAVGVTTSGLPLNTRWVSELSPNGRYIAFGADNRQEGLDIPDGQMNSSNIFVRDIVAGTTTTVPVPVSAPTSFETVSSSRGYARWNATSEYLTFSWGHSDTSSRESDESPKETVDIFRYSPSTGATEKLTSAEEGNHFVEGALSADGTALAYVANTGDRAVLETLYLRDLTTGSERTIVSELDRSRGSHTEKVSISDDGKKILFQAVGDNHHVGGPGSYVYDADAGRSTLVVPLGADSPGSARDIYQQVISGDGTRVIYEAGGEGLVPGVSGYGFVYYGQEIASGDIHVLSAVNADNPVPGIAGGSVSRNGRFAVFGTLEWLGYGPDFSFFRIYMNEWPLDQD